MSANSVKNLTKIFFKKTIDKWHIICYTIIKIKKGDKKMVEIIDFILENVENIQGYNLVGYSMDATIVEFIMKNGEKIQKDF